MERALNPELLSLALGQHDSLPTPEELSSLLAEAELQILLGDPQQEEQLWAIGWYLHAIGSSAYALEIYGLPRQRSAFQVSAHIFDLALQQSEVNPIDRMKFCFAAQIAYLRSEFTPNSLAIYRRSNFATDINLSLVDNFSEIALLAAIRLLGFDVSNLYDLTDKARAETDNLLAEWGLDDILLSPFGASAYVSSAARDIMSFLVYGNLDLLNRARGTLQSAIDGQASAHDTISRWVAAHLLTIADDFEKSSVWTVLPPNIPPITQKVFAHSSPRMLTLWPPQLQLLSNDNAESDEADMVNPLTSAARRVFLSTPTSGGKTMLAQLLIVSHLVTEGTAVCYIAPTRSLCREVRSSLESRLRFLRKTIVHGLPEIDLTVFDLNQPLDVEVMTPERLSFLIRADSSALLQRFGMFVFDEVHSVGEQGRGWTLEEDLSFLHYKTKESKHRIILVSAAVGNRNHFVQWMNIDGQPPYHRHTDWRGPRRLHAIWTTSADWNNAVDIENTRATKNRHRQDVPQRGQLHVRVSHNGSITSLTTEEAVGTLVRHGKNPQNLKKNDAASTPFYRSLIPLINFLANSGPVLVIESTRPATVLMAKALAETQKVFDSTRIRPLIDLVTARLGSEHPLHAVLEKGVSYHHGSLPAEIRAAIEDAVAREEIRFLIATTTMTEGINLPVRSVVIASQGSHTAGNHYHEYITGSKLVNAIGRAGRATKETEGIVVLALDRGAPTNEDFQRLTPSDDEMHVESMLAMEVALDELAQFEQDRNNLEDAVLEVQEASVADFLKFVWFVAANLEKVGATVSFEKIEMVLTHTLGWQQLDDTNQQRWMALVSLMLERYERTDLRLRQRWATSGTTLSSAHQLEAIAHEITARFINVDISAQVFELISIFFEDNRLERLLALPESPRKKTRIHNARGGRNRQEIIIPVDTFLQEWLLGSTLIDLANKYLHQVNDLNYRYEQLGDVINQYFEIYFPWVLGTIIRWVNQDLAEQGMSTSLPTTIPAHVRYGIDDPVALRLMMDGIDSRSLARKMTTEWRNSGTVQEPYEWIRQMSLSEWQDRFDASPIDLRNLLSYARDRQGNLGATLINTGNASLIVQSLYPSFPEVTVILSRRDSTTFSRFEIKIKDNEHIAGFIKSCDQSDVEDILKMGFHIDLTFSAVNDQGILQFRVIPPNVVENE